MARGSSKLLRSQEGEEEVDTEEEDDHAAQEVLDVHRASRSQNQIRPMKNSNDAAIRAIIARSKSIESSFGDAGISDVRLAVVPLHDLHER